MTGVALPPFSSRKPRKSVPRRLDDEIIKCLRGINSAFADEERAAIVAVVASSSTPRASSSIQTSSVDSIRTAPATPKRKVNAESFHTPTGTKYKRQSSSFRDFIPEILSARTRGTPPSDPRLARARERSHHNADADVQLRVIVDYSHFDAVNGPLHLLAAPDSSPTTAPASQEPAARTAQLPLFRATASVPIAKSGLAQVSALRSSRELRTRSTKLTRDCAMVPWSPLVRHATAGGDDSLPAAAAATSTPASVTVDMASTGEPPPPVQRATLSHDAPALVTGPALVAPPKSSRARTRVHPNKEVVTYEGDDALLLQELQRLEVAREGDSVFIITSILRQVAEPDNLIKFCLLHGASVNECNLNGWTPLHEAVKRGDESLCALFLRLGADCNKRRDADGDGDQYQSPFEYACMLGHIAMVRVMLAYGANVSKLSNGRLDAFSYAKSPLLRNFILDYLVDIKYIYLDPSSREYEAKRWQFASLEHVPKYEECEEDRRLLVTEVYEFSCPPPVIYNLCVEQHSGVFDIHTNYILLEDCFRGVDPVFLCQEHKIPSDQVLRLSRHEMEGACRNSLCSSHLKNLQAFLLRTPTTERLHLVDLPAAFMYGLLPHCIPHCR